MRNPVSNRPAVIIPTFNRAELLERALKSLAVQTIAHSVVVVDNGSTDATAEIVGRFEQAVLVRLPENVGFARAVNVGAHSCDERTIVVMNNDVTYRPSFLEALCGELRANEGIVMTAGVLLQAVDETRIDTAGIMFDRTLLAFDHLHGRPVSSLSDAAEPLGPSAAAAAFDRDAFESVGGFDERFFAYLEDVDLAVRIVAQGGRCRLAREARGVHRQSATVGAGSKRKNELMGWSRGYTLAKYGLHRRPRSLLRAGLGEFVIASGQLVIDRTAAGFGARLRGFRAGLRVPALELPRLPPAAQQITLSRALRERLRRVRGRSGRPRSG